MDHRRAPALILGRLFPVTTFVELNLPCFQQTPNDRAGRRSPACYFTTRKTSERRWKNHGRTGTKSNPIDANIQK